MMETISCVKAVVTGYRQYRSNPNDTNLVQLKRHLDVLISVTSQATSLACFDPKDVLATECLTCLMDILNDEQAKPNLAQKTVLLLTNLACSMTLCNTLHSTFDVTPCLAVYLKTQVSSLSEQDLLLCIKLLQKVTYNHKVTYQSCIEDLLQILVKQLEQKENEVTQWCLALLANMCRHNLPIQLYLKSQDDVKHLYKKLIRYLSCGPETRIYALCILTSLCLLEDTGRKFFHPENIHQTFHMMFSVLINEDSRMAHSYTVGLFSDLVSNVQMQDALATYNYLKQCLLQVFGLLSDSDPDRVTRILELLLAFCSVNSLRSVICQLVTGHKGTDDASAADHLSVVIHWAAQSVEPNQMTSLHALEFLKELYEEMLDQGDFLPLVSTHSDAMLSMVTEVLMSPMDQPQAPPVKIRCLKLVRALQLLCTLCCEESLRMVVGSSIDIKTYLQLVDFQFDNNTIALHCSGSVQAEQQDWSEAGADVVLATLDLMSQLKTRPVKGRKKSDLEMASLNAAFLRVLQDCRLVPFLASGLTSQNRERVQMALKLIGIASTLGEFSPVVLGEAVVACNARNGQSQDTALQPMVSGMAASIGLRHCNKENIPFQPHPFTCSKRLPREDLESSVQGLVDKLQTGLELKDMKGSEIISVYEHRLQSLETKENHLQDLLEAKALALSQADRLIAQYRCRKAQSDAECSKFRALVQTSEKRSEEYCEKLHGMEQEKERMTTELEVLAQENNRLGAVAEEHKELSQIYAEQTQRLENVQRTLSTLKQEHQTVTEMHEMLRRHNETLKQQHDVASQQLAELDDERKALSRQLKEKEAKATELGRNLKKTEGKLKEVTRERDALESAIDSLRQNLSKTEQTVKELQHQVSSLELVCRQHEVAIKQKDGRITDLQAELDKHTRLAALIHNLSSGQPPADIKLSAT